jgi:eukaryotic-like serine/threonine-protein kinase
MPAIPDEFFTQLTTAKGTSSTTAEFQHLLNHQSVLDARGLDIDDAQRYSLLREVASGLAFLHKHGVCVGDISPKNLLFSLTPHEAVYFIDCDAMRINGVSALPQVETPGWNAPAGEELATIYSDTYKLGLLALRLLAADQDTKNPKHLPTTTPALLRQIITDTLKNEPQRRPLPDAWTYVLGHAIEEAQHRKKTAAAATAPVSIALGPPPTPVVRSRPSAPTAHSKSPAPAAHSAPPISPPPPPGSTQPAGQPVSPRPKIWARLGWAALAVAALLVVVPAVALINDDQRAPSGAQTTSSSQPSIYSSSAPSSSFVPTSTYTPTPTPEPTTSPPPPDLYIAIASAQPDGWGWATSSVSGDDAEAKAVAKCSEVNTGCKWNSWMRNGCVAIAKANNGDIWGGHGSSRAEAEQDALNETHGGRVLKSVCT